MELEALEDELDDYIRCKSTGYECTSEKEEVMSHHPMSLEEQPEISYRALRWRDGELALPLSGSPPDVS